MAAGVGGARAAPLPGGDAAGAGRLIAAGVDLGTLDGEGASLPHDAALGGNPRVVRALLARGLDPNQTSARGITPACEAVRARRVEALRALLAAGRSPRCFAS